MSNWEKDLPPIARERLARIGELTREEKEKMIDSLSFGSTPAELQRKRDGILAIETLKAEQNTSVIELNLNLMEDLQKRYRAEIEQAYNGIRAEVEGNPQLRVKQVQQGQNTMIVQLSVEEAIKQLPQWRDFLSDQEKRYSQEFAKVTEKLKRELK